MTTYYVGTGGNDGNAGTSWALRKLTLNGAEDIPVVAADTVYVGPGVYRELLTCDVDGSAGNIITYIGDVTGENTDGIGGRVRITGSDDDLTATRAQCILATSMDYRTFRGFWMDMVTTELMNYGTTTTNNIIEDCVFGPTNANAEGIKVQNAGQSNFTIRRCVFWMVGDDSIVFTHSSAVDDATHLVENCLFVGSAFSSNKNIISSNKVGGIIIKNCTLLGSSGNGIVVTSAVTVSQTVTVNNCIIMNVNTALSGTVSGEIIENYNTIYEVSTARFNVATGANSDTNNPMLEPPPMLLDGFQLWKGVPWTLGLLNQNSSLLGITGTGTATDDLHGITRPATAAKISRGAIQAPTIVEKSTTQVNEGTYSFEMSDAGREHFQKPVTPSVSVTISVNVYREASYAGTAPQLIIREPGQADVTLTDAAASGQWNPLTANFTPQSTTTFLELILVSNNTASAGSYAVYWDELT